MLVSCANACAVLVVLGRQCCVGNPYRTSGTEDALMVPVGLVTALVTGEVCMVSACGQG